MEQMDMPQEWANSYGVDLDAPQRVTSIKAALDLFYRYYENMPCEGYEQPDPEENDDEQRPDPELQKQSTLEDWKFATLCGRPLKGSATYLPDVPGQKKPEDILVFPFPSGFPDFTFEDSLDPLLGEEPRQIESILPHQFGGVLELFTPPAASAPAYAKIDGSSPPWRFHMIVQNLHKHFVWTFLDHPKSKFECPDRHATLERALHDPSLFADLYRGFLGRWNLTPGMEEESSEPAGWDLREFLTVADPTPETDYRIHSPKPEKKTPFQMMSGVYVNGRSVDERYEEYTKIVTDPRVRLSPELQDELYQQIVCAKDETEAKLERKRNLLETIEVGDEEQFQRVFKSVFGYGMSEASARKRLKDSYRAGQGGEQGELTEEQALYLSLLLPRLIDRIVELHAECKKQQREHCDQIIHMGGEEMEKTGALLALGFQTDMAEGAGEAEDPSLLDTIIEEVNEFIEGLWERYEVRFETGPDPDLEVTPGGGSAQPPE